MADLYGGEGEAVKVVARVRPLNAVEMERGPAVAVEVLGTEQLRLDVRRCTRQIPQALDETLVAGTRTGGRQAEHVSV